MTGSRWTHKTTEKFAGNCAPVGIRVSRQPWYTVTGSFSTSSGRGKSLRQDDPPPRS
jgi:hypothetical protein